jgi:hypothetical protein
VACPDNDNVPYSAGCLNFLKGATELGMRWRINATDGPAVVATVYPAVSGRLAGPACPDTDNVPYTASCLAFLSGPLRTGTN